MSFDIDGAIIALGSALIQREPLTAQQRELRAEVLGRGLVDFRRGLETAGVSDDERQRLGALWAQTTLAGDAAERHKRSCRAHCPGCAISEAIQLLARADKHDPGTPEPYTGPFLVAVRSALAGCESTLSDLDKAMESYSGAVVAAGEMLAEADSLMQGSQTRTIMEALGRRPSQRQRGDLREQAESARTKLAEAVAAMQALEAQTMAAFPDASMIPTRKDAKGIVGATWAALYMGGRGLAEEEIGRIVDDGAGGDPGLRTDRVRKWLERAGLKPRDPKRGRTRAERETMLRCEQCGALVWASEAIAHEQTHQQ